MLKAIKIKRNQLQFLVPGTPSHQFAYVVFGDFTIFSSNSPYTVCSRSEDGCVMYYVIAWLYFIASIPLIYSNRTKVYIDGLLIVNNDGVHRGNARICSVFRLTAGVHQVYVAGFETYTDSEIEITYSGPDTDGVRTIIGGQPYFYACDPRAPISDKPAFTLCTFKSDPTSAWNGDCTPTVGLPHPRFGGPCLKAIGTDTKSYPSFSGGFNVPVLGSANNRLVSTFLICG